MQLSSLQTDPMSGNSVLNICVKASQACRLAEKSPRSCGSRPRLSDMGITSRSPTSPSSSRATMLLITVAWFGVYAEQRQMTATLTLTAPWATQYRTAPLSLDLHREIAGVEASMLVCSFVVVALLVPFVNVPSALHEMRTILSPSRVQACDLASMPCARWRPASPM